ncbi:MAG: class I SAM-dependent methyltransferase [Polyangia bacterium]|jgi:trans-aconitate methyltransferase|nr:class I SAM-dependent methyltransferase [Polyangia bacterium]
MLKGMSSLGSRKRPSSSGICEAGYHSGRKTRRSLKYRLARRTDEVRRAAALHLRRAPHTILDVGTADGLMLRSLGAAWPDSLRLGLDLSRDLLVAGLDPDVRLLLADAAALPVRSASVDLLVATAVIEHVPDPLGVLIQMRDALRPGGLVVLTTPDPFWEHLATLVGHLPDEQHFETLTLPRLATLCQSAGLTVVETRRFMLSPIGLPLEHPIEELVRLLGLGFLFANQLVAAMRP